MVRTMTARRMTTSTERTKDKITGLAIRRAGPLNSKQGGSRCDIFGLWTEYGQSFVLHGRPPGTGCGERAPRDGRLAAWHC